MSALGQKQTFRNVRAMSTLPPKADIGTQPREVRFVPKADVSTRSKQLLDYFVSEQLQRVGYLNAERSGRLQVDDEFEFGRLHHRKVGGLRALEDLTGVEADLTAKVRNIDSIAHQSARFGFLASGIGRGNPMAGRKRRKLDAAADEERIGGEEECVGPITD